MSDTLQVRLRQEAVHWTSFRTRSGGDIADLLREAAKVLDGLEARVAALEASVDVDMAREACEDLGDEVIEEQRKRKLAETDLMMVRAVLNADLKIAQERVLTLELANQQAKARVTRLAEALRRWVCQFDGQTEPVPPVYWIVELEESTREWAAPAGEEPR
jgi:Rad3-related DNA helicase